MTAQEVKKFQKRVYDYYHAAGRSLPWRKTANPYRILVSEVMLQQTQVDRVIPKYRTFLKRFPTIRALACAKLSNVLRAWQGLGYNRRAKMLHECAKIISLKHSGKIPDTYTGLVALPGVGPYTASAIFAFAHNKPTPMIETNIRTVYLYHFFKRIEGVRDRELLPIIERTLDTENPRKWYAALMDYGNHLKKTTGNENKRSRHYVHQPIFEGSARQIRGAIVRALVEHSSLTKVQLGKILLCDSKRLAEQLASLKNEGMMSYKKNKWSLMS